MKKLLFAIVLSLATTFAVAAQSDIKIRKKTEIKMPGMPSMSESDLAKLPESARNRFKNMFSRESLVYIKGARMRTDTEAEVPSGMKMEKRRYSIIQQCDKQRTIQFNDKKKKYYAENFIGSSTGNSSSSKGSVTVSLNVTDTGERMQLFGYNARHLKQTMTIAPSGNACLKSKMEMEVDGWYADIPEFSCPYKPDMKGIQQNGNCEDEVRMEIKGAQLSGIALKEIRVIKMDGQTVTTMEEVRINKNDARCRLF